MLPDRVVAADGLVCCERCPNQDHVGTVWVRVEKRKPRVIVCDDAYKQWLKEEYGAKASAL